MSITSDYKHLVFTNNQLFFSAAETRTVALDFFGRSPQEGEMTDKDRAFIQAALLIAVDKSEKAGFLFDVYSSAVKASVSKSVTALVKSLAKKTAKKYFKKIIDDDPKVSAVGKAAVQYSFFASDWRVRCSMGDTSMLQNFLVP